MDPLPRLASHRDQPSTRHSRPSFKLAAMPSTRAACWLATPWRAEPRTDDPQRQIVPPPWVSAVRVQVDLYPKVETETLTTTDGSTRTARRPKTRTRLPPRPPPPPLNSTSRRSALVYRPAAWTCPAWNPAGACRAAEAEAPRAPIRSAKAARRMAATAVPERVAERLSLRLRRARSRANGRRLRILMPLRRPSRSGTRTVMPRTRPRRRGQLRLQRARTVGQQVLPEASRAWRRASPIGRVRLNAP